ncbi:N-acetyltransferase B complex non catalytic subunit-domain-containing protein [Sporodiniella umbellata]|nr:N-acetyltransferase B complex non catalytic subunit-domain-containing protein [Sporodiniella umbellata]
MVLDYATEKKLRPLYEAIDEEQHKLALTHCSRLLKKSPDWPLVKALKALTLVRTGKDDEGLQICDQVKKTIPTDDSTLQALTLALKELGKHSMIVELYENVSNQQPKNEEFGNQWFMAMVRNNDYKGQQAAAIKLQRTFKNDKYLFWSIMSLALQGQSGNALSYTLAERMMSKALEENRLKQVEHLRLYLLILMDQKKNKEALNLLLDHDIGRTALRDPEVQQIKSELLRNSKRWTEVLEESKRVLKTENQDDWFNWLAYFEAVEAIMKDEENSEKILSEAKELIAATQKLVLDNKLLKRGPFLAELELLHRLRKTEQKVDDALFLENIVLYFSRFGSKSCIFEDLQGYVGFLKGDKHRASGFVHSLEKTIEPSKEKAAQIKNVYKHVNIRKIEHLLDLHTNTDTKKAIATVENLWQQYQEALPLGKDLEKTELQFGDEFVLIASHILLNLYQEHKEHIFVLQAILLLEDALVKSIHNFRIKLMLVRLYVLLGVYNRPMEIYKRMEIKQIQFDTMTYISLGCVEEIESIFYDSLQIYRSNNVETPEMLVRAYQYGTYSKIQEFIEFRRRLDTSLQHAITEIELKRLDFLRSSFQAKFAVQFFNENDMKDINHDSVLVNIYSDNRDFKVFANYCNDSKFSAEQLSKPTKSTNKSWAQLYSFILNILSSAVKGKDNFTALTSEASKFLECENVKEEVTTQEYFLGKYVVYLSDALDLVNQKKANEASEKIDLAILIIQEQYTKFSSECHTTWESFHSMYITLEAFSYTLVLVEMFHRALGLNSKDARKKAISSAQNNPLMLSLVKLQEASKVSLQKLQANANEKKSLFRAQLQKKLYKELVDSDNCVSYLALKENQGSVNNHIKFLVSSWSQSTASLADEIDRRLQKL